MPSPRHLRPAVAIQLQYDPTERTREQQNEYQNSRRRKLRSDATPGGRSYRGGYPVEVRNRDLPFKPYTYRGAGHDIMECECHA